MIQATGAQFKKRRSVSPTEIGLPPYPRPGDAEGWSRWWQTWREAYRDAPIPEVQLPPVETEGGAL